MPCIKFDNVTFSYDKKNVFKDFSCQMEYNKSYGLVGVSGSGKSTLTKLLMRLYDTDSGKIYFHNCDIKKYSLYELRKSIGIVPQNPFIFQMSIIENIRIANSEATMPEIIRAMDIARVHEFVNDLPDGWNTIVGEGGYGLSGGQKQRIAIARAVPSQQKWTQKSFKKRNESQYFVNLLKLTALFHGLLAGDLCRHDVPAKERSSPRTIRPGTSLSYRLLIVKQLSRHKR